MTAPSADLKSMSHPAEPLPLETMDPQLKWIQPGGGIICHIEIAWGYVRRWWLKTFRKDFVRKMAETRKGSSNGCPHEVIDPRDLKFYRNQKGYYWEPKDDPFLWRDQLPFARTGLAELFALSFITFCPAIAITILLLLYGESTHILLKILGWFVVFAGVFFGSHVVWFFRNPKRTVPADPNLVISPADGTITSIEEIAHDDFIGGPAIQIGVFLSVWNVHINRTPVASRVIGLSYKPGKYLNAMRPESARENEQLAVRVQEIEAPYRRYIIRQITGAVARRIVNWVKPGDLLARGEQFGMIKMGSRTELVMPREAGMTLMTKMGDTIRAGESILAKYK